jgi:hypothetical protein
MEARPVGWSYRLRYGHDVSVLLSLVDVCSVCQGRYFWFATDRAAEL